MDVTTSSQNTASKGFAPALQTRDEPRSQDSPISTKPPLEKWMFGILIPVATVTLILLLLLSIWTFKRSRKKRTKNPAKNENTATANSSEASHLFLQRKAELDAEENAKAELEARERRHELDGNPIYEIGHRDRKHEMSTERSGRAHKEISLDVIQDLGVKEHSQELATS